MAHFAKMDANNLVLEVIVVSNDSVANLPFPESEPLGIAFCQSLYGQDTNWLQTSYNANFRGNYAGIGYSYWSDIDQFVPPQPGPEYVYNPQTHSWEIPLPPQPYPSWVYNPATARWEAPVAKPKDGYSYTWDEPTLSWVRGAPL